MGESASAMSVYYHLKSNPKQINNNFTTVSARTMLRAPRPSAIAIASPRPSTAMPLSHRLPAANAPPSTLFCVDAPPLGGSRSRLPLITPLLRRTSGDGE